MELESLEIKIQAQAQQASGQIDALVTRLGRLSSALSGLNTGNLNSLSTGVNRLAVAMTAMRGIDTRTFSAVARNVSKLGSINSKQINAAAGSMRQISNAVKGLSGMSASVKGLTELASAIKQLGYTSSTKAIENIPKLAVAMRQLMAELSKAPMVSQNLINMTNALAKLARTGGAAGTAARGITRSFEGFSASSLRARKSSFSLASAIGKVYATYWALFRAFRLLRDAIDISSAVTEADNVVRQAFGKYEKLVDDLCKVSIKKFGMSELSVKQFAGRFQSLGTALDIPQGKMAKMAITLTELTGDLASYYDVSQEDVAKSLQSVFTGTTAPMRRYGVDLTQATLNEWLMKKGIDAKVKSMNQAQKAVVRYEYTLERTKAAQGDFLRTSDSWHNTLTVVTESFKDLGKTVGDIAINAFKPFLRVLGIVAEKVNSFVEMVLNALGSIFGWKFEVSKKGASGLADSLNGAYDSMDDLSDAAGSAGKNTGGIAKNAKKAKKEIQQATRAFDELKVISKQSKDNTSGSGSGGSGGGSGGSGGGGTGTWVETPSAFKKFKSSIKDLEGLGESIRDALVNAVGSIEWDKVYAKASGFGTGLAEFLNGLFSEDKKGNSVFTATADVIAGTLNTAIFASKGFTDKFDFETFGKNLAHGFNRFFKKFKWKQCAEAINGWVDGFWSFAVGFFGDLSWSDIFNGLKTFLTSLSSKTIATILGAYALKKFSKSAVGALADSVGGQVLTAKIKKAFFTIAAITVAAEGGLTIGEAIGKKIAELTQPEEMQKYQTTFNFSDLFSYSLDDWEQGFSDWWDDTFGPAFELMALDMATGNYKFKIPFTDFELPSFNEAKKGFSNWLSGVNKYWSKKKDSVLEIGTKIKNKASEVWNGFKKDWKNVKNKVAEFKTKIASKASDLWEKFKTSWGKSKTVQFLLKIGSKAKDLWSNFKTAWGESRTAKFFLKIGSKVSELWKDFKESWGEKRTVKFLTKRATKISELWKDFKDSWGDKKAVTIGIGFAKDSLNNLWSSVKGFFGGKTVSVGTKATKKADGGVFSGGSWKPIKKYAVGGLPNMGQMFVAREAGPELVGTLGGHTAVMNNDQIVSSVSYGVAQAVKEVIQPLVKMGGGNNRPIQISLDGKVIFDSTRQSAQEYFNRTGMSPFPV